MKRNLIALAALGLFAFGCSESPTETQADLDASPEFAARGPVMHRVSLGGADICAGIGLPPGCDANNSFIAIEYADGSVSGQWHDQWAGGVGVHTAISCLAVDGNDAWVSGTVTNAPFAGVNVMIRVQDNGQSGDRASFLVGTANASDCLGMPPLGLLALTNGQVKVK